MMKKRMRKKKIRMPFLFFIYSLNYAIYITSNSYWFRFLKHNVEANMQEYELLAELMNIIGCWFYEDVHILVFHSFLKQKV